MQELMEGYTFTSIFRKIAVVGDSLSSGEFEVRDAEDPDLYHYYDKYEYSWGQFLARRTGSTVYNLSRGGMTAKWYLGAFAEDQNYWSPAYRAQAYILAFGVNDILYHEMRPGTLADDSETPADEDSFLRYYAEVIRRYREMGKGDAKFFLMTMPREYNDSDVWRARKEAHRDILKAYCDAHKDCYLLNLYDDVDVYTKEFKDRYYLNNHLNPLGYVYTASLVDKMISDIIRENPGDFNMVGMSDLIKSGR